VKKERDQKEAEFRQTRARALAFALLPLEKAKGAQRPEGGFFHCHCGKLEEKPKWKRWGAKGELQSKPYRGTKLHQLLNHARREMIV